MRPRIFTLEEANSAIPRIAQAIERIVAANSRIKILTEDIKNLFDIWGESIYDPRNVDHRFCIEKLSERTRLLQEMQHLINNVQSLGCFVKDVNQGLVDFYSENDGQFILLCWRRGEPRIRFWHNTGDSFAARRRIEELKAAAAPAQKTLQQAPAARPKPQYIQ